VSMYGPEHFLHNGIFRPPYPARTLGSPPPPQLYNVREDPCEKTDLASRHPEHVARLSGIYDSWFDAVERERRSIQE
jgi:hypothetical protein